MSILSCQKPKHNYVTLSGNINHLKVDTLSVYGNNRFKRQIAVNKDGSFKDTLTIKDGFFALTDGKNQTFMNLKKGYSLNITADADDFENTIAFTGDGAGVNNYLVKKIRTQKKFGLANLESMFLMDKDDKGGKTSLKSLRGKYVYIDVWATWCAPCRQQIPALKKIEESYKDKNIYFVSLSIDKQTDKIKWLKMIREMKLGGIQLLAENDWNSKFVKDYQITGIPRFILIDPEGNIVDANAPRPTDPRLIALFNSLKL